MYITCELPKPKQVFIAAGILSSFSKLIEESTYFFFSESFYKNNLIRVTIEFLEETRNNSSSVNYKKDLFKGGKF
jgi:hypothetical protein